MTLRRTAITATITMAVAVLASLLVACGGSGSETPRPVEPISPAVQRNDEASPGPVDRQPDDDTRNGSEPPDEPG